MPRTPDTPAPGTSAPETPETPDALAHAALSPDGEERRFRRGLVGLVALGALSQILIQTQAYGDNPMVLVPQVDAAVLWERAGEIAGGDVVDDAPFETAPLMLWFTALVRALGGGLAALGAVQSILHVATAVLIALVTRRWTAGDRTLGVSPATVGVLAGGLFLLVDEPAAGTSRVLGGTLQLFVGALLLRALTIVADEPTIRRAAVAGALAGLATLAFPPLLVFVPALAIWLALRARRTPRVPALFLAASVAAIAPATIHNALACGELVPISSQAGLTFYHGNNPQANGTFAAVGVVNSKESQALDSLTTARDALGDPEAGWNDASDYWLGQGLEWWAAEPMRAIGVAGIKLWYAVSGRHYGDVYQPWMERRDGVASRLWLAPVPVAWLIPIGLVALFLLTRRSGLGASFPLHLFVFVPVSVCVVFWYTPRYRLPSLVALAPLGAVALARMARGGREGVALGAAVVIGVGSGPLNDAIGFDRDAAHERRHAARMAAAYGRLGRHDDGLRYLRRDLELAPGDAEATSRVVQLLLYLGRDSEACATIESAPDAVRGLPGPRTLLAWTRATSADPSARDGAAALALAEALVVELGPDPGLLDTRAAARARTGDFPGAITDAREAIEALTPGDPLRTEIEGRLALYESGQAFAQPARLRP